MSHVVAETDGSGAMGAYYVRAGNELLAAVRGSDVRYFVADGLGSIREMRDSTGATTDSYGFTAFGETSTRTGTDGQPYGFAGEAFEALSRLSYNRARWMDPKSGRFISTDPLPGRLGSPRSQHRYIYGGDDPVNMTDPTGLEISMGGLHNPLRSLVNARGASGGTTAFLFNNGLFKLKGDYDKVPGGPGYIASEILQTYQTDLAQLQLIQFFYADVATGIGLNRFSYLERGLRPQLYTEWDCAPDVDGGALFAYTSKVDGQRNINLYKAYFNEPNSSKLAGVRSHEMGHALLLDKPDEIDSVVVGYQSWWDNDPHVIRRPLTWISAEVAGAYIGGFHSIHVPPDFSAQSLVSEY